MSVEEYTLKFSMLSKYAPSLVSNSRDEMSRFVTGVAALVREECHTAMLHDDMNLGRLMVYLQSIEESKHKRISRNFKRSGFSDYDQTRLKKKTRTQEVPRSSKDSNKARDCPTIATRGREGKQVAANVPREDVIKAKTHFYALRERGSKPYEDDYDDISN
ncbi:hypothetical protein EJD97_000967 [Solanum chilense]|uniref:Retrotransposon gag domain-containing protein n=1 Tax=Solanum chilense TaxID=4083 RepID=A0A6N2AMI3_SOLCI|nr:hypothetical protein EJD97_000967 [Solanum chilense]